MSKKPYIPLRVRPKNATPELAVELHKTLTLQQIADAWGISKNAVWELTKKAEKRAKKPDLTKALKIALSNENGTDTLVER